MRLPNGSHRMDITFSEQEMNAIADAARIAGLRGNSTWVRALVVRELDHLFGDTWSKRGVDDDDK